jgi:ribosome biogenesis GTPase
MMPAVYTSAMHRATVIATFSRRMRLRLDDGAEVDARIKGKRLRPVCGDRVDVESLPEESDWLITAISERRNELTRPNVRGQVEVLAANLDYLLVVAAAEPRPDWFIVDRYLCAAELMGIDAGVIFNKVDVAREIPTDILEDYRRIGYTVVQSSTESGAGIDEVRALLQAHCAIIVGQSGVGKSSIINCLLGDAVLRTADISEKSREGRHTTVNSAMIPLPDGGYIIDSPGVRDYAPALESSSIASQGFREIQRAGAHCRFANCRHLREPGCAVKDAVDTDAISARRYESYKRIVNLTEQLSAGRY